MMGATPPRVSDDQARQALQHEARDDLVGKPPASSRSSAREAAAGQAAEIRRRRTAADAEELRKALAERVRRLREAEAAGGIAAADRTELETLALRERDEGTTRRVAATPRPDREAERERLIQNNENAQERYTRRLETLGRLVERSERIGQPRRPDVAWGAARV